MSSIIKASAIKALDKATKRLLNKTNRPKQPRSPCNFYTMEKFKFKGTVAENSDKTKQIFEAYKTLSDAERQRYIDQAEKDKIRFKKEFNQWYSTIEGNDQHDDSVIQVAKALKEKYQRLGRL